MNTLKEISLVQYKNHIFLEKKITQPLVAIVGKNGSGKTNILDAIYYSCYGKSYFSKSDKSVQTFDYKGFRIATSYINETNICKAVVIVREDGKKEFQINDEQIKKVSQLLQYNSCVIIAPDDISIINEGSEERRKYLDTILCQIDEQYLFQLMQYNKIIVQRNALLKQMSELRQFQNSLLEVYNLQLSQTGNYIYKKRQQYFTEIKQSTISNYNTIANGKDAVDIVYHSQLHQAAFIDLLQENLQKDIVTCRTNIGIHKDDVLLTMNFEPFKSTASQGQKKSLLLALKLTELFFLQTKGNKSPLLLLDDIMEKLDSDRISFLFGFITQKANAMTIITDVNADRINAILSPLTSNFEIWDLA